MQEKDPVPWEVPPDESYWQALLQEEEESEEGAFIAVVLDHETAPAASVDAAPSAAEEVVADPAVADPPAPLLTIKEPSPIEDLLPPNSTLPEDEATLERPIVSPGPPDPSSPSPDLFDAPSDADVQPTEEAEADPVPEALSDANVQPTEEAQADPVPEALSDAVLTQGSSASMPEESDNWHLFCHYRDAGKAVELTVESYNRGGLLVRWKEIVGFVPASQLCDGLRYGDEQTRLKDLATRVGSSLTLKVIEVDPERNRLILSERAARHVEDPDLEVLDDLIPGDVCHGEVTNLCTFGAFVDLGGVEGLIHISELSWGRVSHPADILQSGEQVEVYVLNVDRDQGRVGLSLKRLQPDPWNTVQERYHVGQVVEGEITSIVNFGAFVRLEEGLEGLIHTSELSGASASGAYALREGARVVVRINSIEGERHRIGLSLE